jgi:ferritin-like metal-binding protein YciE
MEGNTLMAVSRENLTAWLHDMPAMENQAIEILEEQAGRLEHYPELRAKVQTHLDESNRQARNGRAMPQSGAEPARRGSDGRVAWASPA